MNLFLSSLEFKLFYVTIPFRRKERKRTISTRSKINLIKRAGLRLGRDVRVGLGKARSLSCTWDASSADSEDMAGVAVGTRPVLGRAVLSVDPSDMTRLTLEAIHSKEL